MVFPLPDDARGVMEQVYHYFIAVFLAVKQVP